MSMKYRPAWDPENPFVAVSSGTTHIFKTGTQRSEKPVFVNKTASCRNACPIGINIPLAIHKASSGDMDGALGVYLEENPLPGVCGRVCYHPCEKECNRALFDEPINLRSFERFVSDHGRVDIRKGLPLGTRKKSIAVVGSGPAGLSAAYHLARIGYLVTLLEAQSELGGMLRYGIPPYRLPKSILDKDIQRILSLGVTVRTATKVGRDPAWEALKLYDAVFLAVGLQVGKNPFAGKEPNDSILTGTEFLRDPQRWSLEDENQRVLVIGGGNVAIDVARTLLRLRRGQGRNITVLCPEQRELMPAIPEEIAEALEEGISIINGWAPHGIRPTDSGGISLDLFRAEVKRDTATGNLRIVKVGEEARRVPAERVILAVGQGLDAGVLPRELEIKRDKILTNASKATSLPSIFAGGDAAGEKAFVADAIASGKKGALAIHLYLEGAVFDDELRDHQIGQSGSLSFQHFFEKADQPLYDLRNVVTFEQINTLFFSKKARALPGKLAPDDRKKAFEEVTGGLGAESMEMEWGRCFRCGTCIDCENCIDFCPDMSILKDMKAGSYIFNPDYCKGCGMCAVACPRQVISMKAEHA